jgi:hypothetical protein
VNYSDYLDNYKRVYINKKMNLENTKKLTLPQVEKLLKKKLPDFELKVINNVVLVQKTETVKLNVVVEDDYIQVVEAVDFIPKLATAIGIVAVVFYILSRTEFPTWAKIIGYILGFLVGGALGDVLHKARFKKEYDTFKPKVIGFIQKKLDE